MSENNNANRIYSHITKTAFLHVEDALDIGKLRIFAGRYEKGNGASTMTAHWIDVADARVLFMDMAVGKPVDYIEYKGTAGDEPVSRVLKVKTGQGNKVWFRLETGPGAVIGEGAVKPAGDPDVVVNVPFTPWESRRLAMAVWSYWTAWETAKMISPPNSPQVLRREIESLTCPFCNARPCRCDEWMDQRVESGFEQRPDQVQDMAP